MNLIKKLGMTALGLALSAGVGVGISQGKISEAKAADADITYDVTPTKAITGRTESKYVDEQFAYTVGGVAFNTNHVNPNTQQICVKNGDINKTIDSNYYIYNSTAFTKQIKGVSISFSAGTINKDYFQITTGTSTITSNVDFDSSKGGSYNATTSTLTWKFNTTDTFFRLCIAKNGGTVKIGTFTIITGEPSGEVKVTDVSLNEHELSKVEGTKFQLVATVSPEDADNKNVTWSTNNDNASVDENGLVTFNKPGDVTVTVTTEDGAKTDSCLFHVLADPYKTDILTAAEFPATTTSYTTFKDISFNSSALYAGNTANNSGQIQLGYSSSAKDKGIFTTRTGGLIKSVRTNVAEGITKKYQIYAKNEPYTSIDDLYDSTKRGTALLSAASSVSETIELTEDYQYIGICTTDGAVRFNDISISWDPVKPTSINLEAESTSISVGSTVKVTANLVNGTKIISETGVTWSSNSACATVENGVVTGVSAGKATITATSTADTNVKGTIDITVSAEIIHVTGVTLNKNTLTLDDGASEQLTATVLPSGAADKSVSWSSSDETVATVVDGLVTAGNKAGNATITVTTKDGGFTHTCAVTVTYRERASFKKVTSVSELVAGSKYIVVGEKDGDYVAMIHYESGNNIKTVDVDEPENDVITDVKSILDTAVYTIGGVEDAWTFSSGEKCIYAAGGTNEKNNYLKAYELEDLDARGQFTIGISGGVASIVANDATTLNKTLRYNSGSALFSCYSGSDKQADVYLYKYVPNTPTEKTAEAFATFFLSETGSICSSGKASNLEALQGVWSLFETTYSALDDTEKDKVVAEDASQNIKDAVARYDFICGKYNTETVKNLNEFIVGHSVPHSERLFNTTSLAETNNTPMIIVICCAVASVTALGVLIVIKRRKSAIK